MRCGTPTIWNIEANRKFITDYKFRLKIMGFRGASIKAKNSMLVVADDSDSRKGESGGAERGGNRRYRYFPG